MIPPWLKIGVPVLLLVLAFGCGYKVATWKWSGTVADAKAAQAAAEEDAAESMALEASWRADIQDLREQLRGMVTERDQALIRYHEAVNNPPETVIRYRDRWHTVENTVVSEDCVEGVGQLFTYLQSLPGRPQ